MNAPYHLFSMAVATAIVTLAPAGLLLAETAVLTSGHTDIGVGYSSGEFDPHWHTHAGAVVNGVPEPEDGEYAPGDMIARTTATRTTPAGGGGLSALLGVPDGTQIFVMGSSTYPPNLGFGTDELNPADWTGPITITFNPGASSLPSGAQFGLYTTNVSGTTIVDKYFSSLSAAATGADNSLSLTADDHAHYQWGFTEEGSYALNFTWSGTHVTDGPISTSATFTMQAVPEPSTLAMLAMAGGAGVLAASRRLRRASVRM